MDDRAVLDGNLLAEHHVGLDDHVLAELGVGAEKHRLWRNERDAGLERRLAQALLCYALRFGELGFGVDAVAVEVEEGDVRGINTKAQLAEAESVAQQRLRKAALEAGVTLVAPETVFLSADTKFGKDVVVEPYVVFGEKVTVEDGAVIHSFSHIAGAHIGRGASVGPYARLRPGARLGDGARVGNFVEVKEAVIEAGAKANHLSYIGDAFVGANANIGAGTITCNFDGTAKHRTEIGEGAFIGSNSALVAPVRIGQR